MNRSSAILCIALGAATLGGCVTMMTGMTESSMRTLSAGSIGCAADQVEIANVQATVNAATWTATCNGRTFYCSGSGGDASCKEAIGK